MKFSIKRSMPMPLMTTKDETMQKKWKAFSRKINADIVDYGIVLKKINNFLAKPFHMAIIMEIIVSNVSVRICLNFLLP